MDTGWIMMSVEVPKWQSILEGGEHGFWPQFYSGRLARTTATASTTIWKSTMNETYAFRALLEQDDGTTGTYVTIPFDVSAVLGTRARIAVRGTVNAIPFRGSIVPMGGGAFALGVNRDLRGRARAEAGDEVEVVLECDLEPRMVIPPPDLLAALSQHPSAEAAWNKLSYSHRKEIAEAIEAAKKPETRIRRVERAIAELL
jgi:hypothetical protein